MKHLIEAAVAAEKWSATPYRLIRLEVRPHGIEVRGAVYSYSLSPLECREVVEWSVIDGALSNPILYAINSVAEKLNITTMDEPREAR